jgi:hypothetical protein
MSESAPVDHPFSSTFATMISGIRKLGPDGRTRVQKSVRFTASETTRELLEKSTWRKPPPPPQQTNHVLSARGCEGNAVVKFVLSRMLFIRLPTTRRAALEVCVPYKCSMCLIHLELQMYRTRLLSMEQLAAWWPSLSATNQALIKHSPGGSIVELASKFCEVMAEISERSGNQVVTDTLAPLAVPVISSWETSGDIDNVDNTNAAAEIAAQGKKGMSMHVLKSTNPHLMSSYSWKCARKRPKQVLQGIRGKKVAL